MKIGILECGHALPDVAAAHGSYPDMFAALLADFDFTFAAYDVEHMVFPAAPSECDGWLITGSRHGAYEDHPFIPPLEVFIRDVYGSGTPMVGICFGHQIIAQALGGHVEKFEGGWALGRTEYDFDDAGPLALNAWHQDQVLRIPQGAKTIARNAFCAHAALIYGDRALTIQPHPEFHGGVTADIARLRKGTADYPDDQMERVMKMAADTPDNAIIAARIGAFFQQTGPGAHG